MTDITEITRRALENKQPTPITKQIITALARERLALVNGETGLTYAVECAMALINKAREGDVAALRELLDRVEGKVPQAVAMDLNATVRGIISAEPLSPEEWETQYGEQRPRIGNGNGSHMAPAVGTAKGSH